MSFGKALREAFERRLTPPSAFVDPAAVGTRPGAFVYPAVALFLVVFLTLSPGLYGVFYLDDFPNLSPLALVHEPGGFWHVVLNGNSGPLGRPLAMLSFALQADHWPTNPWGFKLFNLILHGVNTVLVFGLTGLLLRLAPLQVRWPVLLSTAAALLWSLAPLHLSAVFYVVQRMSLLSAFFTLLALVGYLAGRLLWLQNRTAAGYLAGSVSLVAGLALGTLSKENAVLLPVYVLVLETTLLASRPRPKGWPLWCATFLCLPLLALAGYLAWDERYLDFYAMREFSPLERLLTQARALTDYLAAGLWPASARLGLFHDDYPLSRGLLDPPGTLVSMVILGISLSAALAVRRRQPVLAMAVLWFLGGHSLESSILGLELYFEHRNYLPLYGPSLAVAWLGSQAGARSRGRITRAIVVGMGLGYLGVGAMTAHQEATLWGQPHVMVRQKLLSHPDSLRVRLSAASDLARAGDFAGAAELLRAHTDAQGVQPGIEVRLLYLQCFEPALRRGNRGRWLQQLGAAPYDRTMTATLQNLLTSMDRGECAGLPYAHVERILLDALENPRFDPARWELSLLLAHARSRMNDYPGVMAALAELSAEENPTRLVLIKAAFAIQHGRVQDARRLLRQAEDALSRGRQRRPVATALFDWGRFQRHRLTRLHEQLARIAGVGEGHDR